jgi:hypothetical protein
LGQFAPKKELRLAMPVSETVYQSEAWL